MGLFSSSSKSKTETVPYAGARPNIDLAMQLARGAQKTPLQYFPGQTYAGQTASEAEAIAQLQAGAGAYPGILEGYMGPGAEAWQSAVGAPQAALGMNLQDVVNNPALTGAADAIQARVNRNLQENILPGLTTQFMGYGGLGGTRQGVAEGLAARGTSDVLSENLARMYGDAWAQGLGAETSRYLGGLQAQAGALSRMPGMIDTALSEYTRPAALLGQAGGLERAEEQRAIDEAMSRFQFQQMEPWQRAGMALDLALPVGQAFSTTKSKSKSSPSTFGAIGQALGAAGGLLGAGFGGPAGLMGGLGALGGLGAMGGAPMGGAVPMFNNPWTYAGAGVNPGAAYVAPPTMTGMYSNPWTAYSY